MFHSRWKRVEMYAKWKQGNFLKTMPFDIVNHIALYLNDHEVTCLIESLLGHSTNEIKENDFVCVPRKLLSISIINTAKTNLVTFLHTISDEGFYKALNSASLLIYPEWTPFSSKKTPPIAEFRWHQESPHARLNIDYNEITKVVLNSLQKHKPTICLFGYNQFLWSSGYTQSLTQNLSVSVQILPHYIDRITSDMNLKEHFPKRHKVKRRLFTK